MAFTLVSASPSLVLHNSGATCLVRTTKNPSCRAHFPCHNGSKSTFASGSRLLPMNFRTRGGRCGNRTSSISIRCEQSTKGGSSLDIWLGRGAMVGFAVAITVEIATGKGLLENFGLTTPLPTVALAVTGLVGVLTAVFIFQSASKN